MRLWHICSAICSWLGALRPPKRCSASYFNFAKPCYARTLQTQSSRIQMRFAWQLRPKHHIFCHIVHEMVAGGFNCRYFHCFRDEAAMGVAKRVLESIRQGPFLHPIYIPSKNHGCNTHESRSNSHYKALLLLEMRSR